VACAAWSSRCCWAWPDCSATAGTVNLVEWYDAVKAINEKKELTRLTIELTPEEDARLRALALTAGVDPVEWARRLLAQQLSSVPPGQATRRLLGTWAEDDVVEDPADVRAAEEELAAFKQAMNASRTASGARLLYP
jgi:hypothetical protein